MRSIFPAWCRIASYILLIVAVFFPMIVFLFNLANESTFPIFRALTKAIVVICLLIIMFTRSGELTDEEQCQLRRSAIMAGFVLSSLLFMLLTIVSILIPTLETHINMMGLIYLSINVICLEFFFQKRKIENKMRRN